MDLVPEFLTDTELAITAAGIIIMLFGVVISIRKIIEAEVSSKGAFEQYDLLKKALIQKIIISLDFFVVADLIKLALISDLPGIYALALIVGTRTVLSWSLGKEISLSKGSK